MAFNEDKYEQAMNWLVEETVNMVNEDYADEDLETRVEKAEEYMAEAFPDLTSMVKEQMEKS